MSVAKMSSVPGAVRGADLAEVQQGLDLVAERADFVLEHLDRDSLQQTRACHRRHGLLRPKGLCVCADARECACHSLADGTQQRTGNRNSAPAGVLVVDRRASGMTTVDAAPAATSGDAVIAARRVPPKRDHHMFQPWATPPPKQEKKTCITRSSLEVCMAGLAGWLAG